MCGRYTLHVDTEDLQQLLPNIELPTDLEPRYNIAPTQDCAVVPNDGSRAVALFRWGLVPYWADDPRIGNRMINARAETVGDKPAFRSAFRRRRCLVLADGFFEWRAVPGEKSKQPMHVRLRSGKPFAFAGLWERWRGPGDRVVRSFTIVTTTANELVREIHDRMPVMVPPQAHATWLAEREADPDELGELLVPYPSSELVARPVGRLVGNPRNDTPECIVPIG